MLTGQGAPFADNGSFFGEKRTHFKVKFREPRLLFKAMEMNTTMIQEQSISTVITGYSEKLYAFIRSRVPGEDDAKDVLQEVWYQLSHQSNLNDIAHMSGWLYRVTRNKIADLYRKSKTGPREIPLNQEGEEIANTNMQEPALFDLATGELKEMFYEKMMEVLEELPAAQREVFIRNEIEDQTLQQIADDTGWSIKTIISRKRYAIQFLRKRLMPYYAAFLQH